ncbi:hypothetical protein QC764_200780 [Podospora pseudoanserina]|uniref:Uncharacterized protein n=1 Tax=Podospora pseudoanserina TaxID=2609844 RepID=A0ABR0IF75_9PEZI|nr:hypothetical protein QC764_200780 [Podospora pseudoanserina]
MATNSPRYDGHQYAQVSGPPSPQTTATGGRVSMEPSSVLFSPPSRYASPVSPFPQTEHHKSSNITFVPIVDTDEDPQYGHTPTGNPVTRTWSAIGNWWPEIASSLFSLLCIPALVILLRSYDDRPLSEWHLTITPNIVIAFIFTICRISFIYPLVQALAQQRWNWFKSPRSLDDFRVFDEASRGPWGSLLLMIRMKGRPLGIVSCLVLITSIATSTLTRLSSLTQVAWCLSWAMTRLFRKKLTSSTMSQATALMGACFPFSKPYEAAVLPHPYNLCPIHHPPAELPSAHGPNSTPWQFV